MIVSNVLTLDIDELSEREWRKLFQKLRFQIEEEIFEPWRVIPSRGVVELPRGAWTHLPDSVEYIDQRVFPKRARESLDFTAELDAKLEDGRTFENQQQAVTSILQQEQGIVVRPPGSGKTNIILAACAMLPTRCLILVHTEDILQQWVDRISEFIPDAKIGVIRGSRNEIGDITVATVQTFKRRMEQHEELKSAFGLVCLDEAHHAAASTFEQVLNEMRAVYRIGVTATEKRADGKQPLMQLVIGPVIHREKFKSKVPVYVLPAKEANFFYRMRGSWDYRGLLDKLVSDEKRNQVIAARADMMIRKGHSVLVLSREIQHLKNIQAAMTKDAELLTGQRTKKERTEILRQFREGKITCLLATQLADEALDVPILSCVILTFPGKHDGRIIQQVGRALREHPLKSKAVIIDIVDDRVHVLRRQWIERKRAYRKMRIPVKKRRTH